jgi:hypothetical protein
VKKELASMVKKERLWWEEKLELQATLARHPDDLEDAPGKRLLEAMSFDKVQPMDDNTTTLWSALDIDNFIRRTGVERCSQ